MQYRILGFVFCPPCKGIILLKSWQFSNFCLSVSSTVVVAMFFVMIRLIDSTRYDSIFD
ncbi:hypothetical protein RhiirA4_124275 [Rhizophagus irregularis]|uniref:Uncharacterized protein n=1 Tax=Rhizophagus irregularis TaxID=588596 RepID=A0A2I1GAL3_9GLOM|nr:hypothetical protein RhiirA4_124275 [Rhizophagus irregularis]